MIRTSPWCKVGMRFADGVCAPDMLRRARQLGCSRANEDAKSAWCWERHAARCRPERTMPFIGKGNAIPPVGNEVINDDRSRDGDSRVRGGGERRVGRV